MAGELIQDHLNEDDEIDSYLAPLDDVKPVGQEKDSIDDFLIDLEEPKKVNATTNVYQAKKTNPDQSAKALDLSNKTGLPHDTVERNFDSIDKNVKSEEDNTTVQNSGFLQKYLADLSNAKVSSDDINTLDKIQKAIEEFGGWLATPQDKAYADMTLEEKREAISKQFRPTDPTRHARSAVAEVISTVFGAGFLGSGEMLEASARQLDQLLTGGISTKAEEGTLEYYLTPSTWLKEAGRGAKIIADVIDIPESEKTFGTKVAGTVGQITGQALLTMANPELGRLLLFSMGAEQQAARPDIADDPQHLRDMKIILGALGTGLSEKLSLDFLMRKLPPGARGGVLNFLKDKLSAGGVEAVQEVVENMWHDLVAVIGHDDKDDIFNWESLWESASVAFGGAFTFRTLFQTLLPGKARGGNVQAAEAKVEKYKNLKDTVLESKTFERHKGKFEEFVDTSLEDATDPNVYFDAEEVNTFFQSREESPQEVLEQLGIEAETWGQAVSSGGDIKVPLSKFLSLADTEYYDPMLQDIRTNLGDETLREAVQVSEVQATEIFVEADRILAERENAEELKASGTEVRTLVREQLVATGKFDNEISDRYAALHEAFAITLASKLDITPIEAYRQAAGLRVQAGVAAEDVSEVFTQHGYTQTAEGVAGFSIDRLNFIMREHGYASGRVVAAIAKVNPQDFIDATTFSPELFKDEIKPLDVEALAGEIQTPFLEIENGKIVGHEGRHRLGALAAEGVTSVAIVVKDTSVPHDNKSMNLEGVTLEGQFISEHKKSQPITLNDAVDISYDNAKLLKEKHGTGDILFQTVETMPADEVLKYITDEPRLSAEQMADLTKSIQEKGITKPVVLIRKPDGTLTLEDGHHRARIAKELGLDVPVTIIDQREGETDVQVAARVLGETFYQAPTEFVSTETEAFKKWSGDGEVIEPEDVNDYVFKADTPTIVKVFHGTTHKFDVFDALRSNLEGQFGAINYFTSSEQDASDNYAGEGPDLTQRIESRAEQIDSEQEIGIDEARKIARKELSGGGEQVMELFVRVDNPFVIGENAQWIEFVDNNNITVEELNERRDEFEDEIDEARWDIEADTPNKLIEAIQTVSDRNDVDAAELSGQVYELDSEVTPETIEQLLRGSRDYMYAEDPETGELIQSQLIAEVIEEMGFDSIILRNAEQRFENMIMEPGTAHVHIFDSNKTNIKSTENIGTFDPTEESIFRQDEVKGQIQFPVDFDEQAVITLFKDADLSTFLHESGHFFLEAYKQLVVQEGTPESINEDMQVLLDWFNVESIDDISTEQHEQFARGFEAYLREGKAPNVELQSIFDRFRAWLLNVYKSMTQLNVKITDEVRGVMDRMLATEEAIKEAEFANSLLPVYTSAEAAGMSEGEYADYKKAYERATNAAQTDTDAELLARVKREQKEIWKQERNNLRDEVLEELYAQPAVQARWFFMRGTLPNGDKLPDVESVKLSRSALIEMYGEELNALWRELPFGKYSVWTKEKSGVHPDEIAPLFGFASGDEMIRAMVATKGNLNKIATDEADLLMRKQYGDPDNPEAIADVAIEKIQNEERSNFLSVELRALEKRAGLDNTPRNVIKRASIRIINETRIADIKEYTYLRTSNKWARKALEAATAGDFEAAADAKRKQLLNQAIYLEAIKARKYTETKTKYLKKFDSPGVRKNLARDYLDQIDSVLEAYDLKKSVSLKEVERRKSLNEWINAQVEQGLEVIIPSDLIERARKRSYKDLPYEEFIGLVDSVKNIEHIARFKQKLIVGKEKRDFAETIDNLVTIALENNTWKQQKLGLKTDLDKAKSFSREFMASHVKMEFLLQQLDGNIPNGPWWNSVFRPLAEAEDNEMLMSQEYMHDLNAIFEQYGAKGRTGLYKETLNTEVELGRTIKRAELISIGLNWGNEGNRTALLRGEDWTQAQIQKVLDEHMTEQDWNTVQSTWNLIDNLWPEIAKLQKELTGVVPAKVEATQIKTKFGAFQGGYYPLQYDVERSIKAFKYEEKMTVDEMFGGNYTQPSTRKGHTIERVGSDGMAVKLDLDVIGAHIVNVIHDLTHRKAVLQADHILQNKQVAETIIAITNRETYQHIRPWLAGIASDKRPFSGWMEQAVGRLRRGATAVNMGWKFTTAIVQPLGYLQSVELLGEKYALKGLKAFYGNPSKARNMIDEVFSKSVMMANRSKTFDRDIRDSIRRIKGDTLNAKIQRSLFSHIGFMDYSVSIPTWIGAYEKSMDVQRAEGKEINETNAIAYADSVVRMSQSAGGAKDLAAIQRGSEFQRSFTMFYSYFSVLHNLIKRRVQVSNKAGFSGANVTRTTMSMLYLVVLPAVLAELIVGRGPDEEEDEEFLPWAATTSLAYPFMTMVGVRDFANALSTGYTYQATPILDAAESFIKTGEGIGDAFTDFAGITDEEFDRQDVKNMAMTSGYLFSLPSRQLYISGEHLYSVLNDEEEFSLYEFLYRSKRN